MSRNMSEIQREALDKRFREFADRSALFSGEVIRDLSGRPPDRSTLLENNLNIARVIFGKWTIEILAILYNLDSAGFQELRRMLGSITSRVLSQKLKMMETQGLVQRMVIDSRPVGVRYALTEKGSTVAKLGEPVFLFLRVSESFSA